LQAPLSPPVILFNLASKQRLISLRLNLPGSLMYGHNNMYASLTRNELLLGCVNRICLSTFDSTPFFLAKPVPKAYKQPTERNRHQGTICLVLRAGKTPLLYMIFSLHTSNRKLE